jgi:hypothetical protein
MFRGRESVEEKSYVELRTTNREHEPEGGCDAMDTGETIGSNVVGTIVGGSLF